MRKARAKTRYDAATYIDTALRPQRNRNIGRNRAQHGAKHFHRFIAQRTSARQRALRDLGRSQRRSRILSAQVGQCAPDQFQPDTGQQAFSRDMRKFAPGKTQDRNFPFICRRKADMAPFALQGNPALTRRNHARHPKTRPRADQTQHATGARRARAHLL